MDAKPNICLLGQQPVCCLPWFAPMLLVSRSVVGRRPESARGGRRAGWLVFAVMLVLCSLTTPSAADTKLAFDVEGNFPDDTAGVDSGWGAGLRLGNVWDLWLIELTPELAGSYHSFGGAAEARAYRAMAGARLALGLVLKPGIFVHAGVGHFELSPDTGSYSNTDLGYDAGLTLDFTLLPVIDLGAHIALAGIGGDEDTEPLSWLAAGGHIAFNLGN